MVIKTFFKDSDGDENIIIKGFESGGDKTLIRPVSPELDLYFKQVPTISNGVDETPSFRQSNKIIGLVTKYI